MAELFFYDIFSSGWDPSGICCSHTFTTNTTLRTCFFYSVKHTSFFFFFLHWQTFEGHHLFVECIHTFFFFFFYWAIWKIDEELFPLRKHKNLCRKSATGSPILPVLQHPRGGPSLLGCTGSFSASVRISEELWEATQPNWFLWKAF